MGFVLGFLFWLAAVQLLVGVVPHVADDITYPLFGVVGAGLAVSRFRRLLWIASGLLVLCFLVFGYTPAVSWLTHGWARADALQKAPAAVVLAAGDTQNGEIPGKGQERILHGYEVVEAGYTPALVISRGLPGTPSWVPAIKEQMERLGVAAAVIETKSVINTRDEALAVAEIARDRGWDQVILVTDPVHMRRAAAVFEKAGVRVVASPCKTWRYSLDNLDDMPSRLTALREWLHEWLGCWSYRRKGWMD